MLSEFLDIRRNGHIMLTTATNRLNNEVNESLGCWKLSKTTPLTKAVPVSSEKGVFDGIVMAAITQGIVVFQCSRGTVHPNASLVRIYAE